MISWTEQPFVMLCFTAFVECLYILYGILYRSILHTNVSVVIKTYLYTVIPEKDPEFLQHVGSL